MKKKTILILGILLISLSANAQPKGGRLDIPGYYDLNRQFKEDSTTAYAIFYPKKDMIYAAEEDTNYDRDFEISHHDIYIESQSTGILKNHSMSKEKGRTGNTITFKMEVDFGDGIVIPFVAKSFYSNNVQEKNWSDKYFKPLETITLQGVKYLLKTDPEKVTLNYEYQVE